jgi:hypothetical protein
MRRPIPSSLPHLLARRLPLAMAMFVVGCDDVAGDAPVSIEVAALTGTACGDPASPNTGANPFDELRDLTVAVRGPAPGTGIFGTLAKKTVRIADGASATLGGIPEGTGREVVVSATGASGTWYGRDTGLTVRRDEDTAASVLLSRMGAFNCVPTPAELENVVFPAAVSLGDGRVLVTGGFRAVSGTAVSNATGQAFLVDTRTGAREFLGSMGAGLERGAHAMVHIPSANQVVILGGATELGVDTTRPFPLQLDVAKALDDAIVFDIATKTFRRVDGRMVVGRAFPRAQLLGDDTVLVTGGGAWPFVSNDDRYVEVDFYDPQAGGGVGDFLVIPKLRSFYTRAAHSLTLIGTSPEGLSELLLWGGTTVDRSLGNPAEIYRQSGRQRDGVNGSFAEVVIVGEAPTFLYFHETTRLSQNRFLVTGGAAHRDGAIQAPAADEAWLLTYVPPTPNQPAPTVQAQRLAGFGPPRVFHGAASHDGRHVSIIGGWNGLGAIADSDLVVSFDADRLPSPWTAETGIASAVRGGHVTVQTPGGSLLLVGGERSGEAGALGGRLAAELFTPASLPLP